MLKKPYGKSKEEPYEKNRKDSYETREDSGFHGFPGPPEERYKKEVLREVSIIKHRAMPRLDEKKIEKLKISDSDVIGSIFDRIRFLKQRIAEIIKNLQLRREIHDEMVKEIEKDISEKEMLCSGISDMDEKRNFKLDISILRREKRTEIAQFWKDNFELNQELMKLLEELEIESKIVSLFKNVNPVNGDKGA